MTRYRSLIIVFVASVLLTIGCVRRTLTIQTVPSEARVYLNDQEIGATPVEIDFTWYGDYDVVIRKEGFETLQTHWRVNAPWYQWPGIDLVTESLVPGTIHDIHERTFELEPALEVDHDQLVIDAKEMRDRTLYTNE